MSHHEPTEDAVDEAPNPGRTHRRRTFALGAAALLGLGAITVGGIASARSSDSSPAAVPSPTVTVSPTTVPVDPIDQEPIEQELVDAEPLDDVADDQDSNDQGPDEDSEDEGRDDGDRDDDGGEKELNISAADEEVFARFDACLVEAGLDDEAFEQLEQAELDGTLDEAQLDERWAAFDAAFESCEPILDGLSPELQTELEALDAQDEAYEECDPHGDEDGEPEDVGDEGGDGDEPDDEGGEVPSDDESSS